MTIGVLILVSTGLRFVFGATLGLGVDESYMVAAGRELSLGYYDHPPAAWWLSWGAAHLFGSETPIVVRLPFIALFALSTWLMYRLGTTISDARGGSCAALLLNLSPVFGVTTGTWVLPDGPLDCALLGAALCLIRALECDTLGWWLGVGLCTGLALFSKYTAVLTMVGALLFLLSSRAHRHWLGRTKAWLAALVALLVVSPVLAWNVENGWASFAFQAGRATGMELHPLAPLLTVAGEALFVLPWIWLPMMAVFIAALWRGPAEWRAWLLCCLAAPPIVGFALVSAWSSHRVLLHWAAPGYLMLFPLLGAEMARRLDQQLVRRALAGTACLLVVATAVVVSHVRWDWLRPVVALVTDRDPSIEAIPWTSLRASVPPGIVVAVPDWRNAGKIAYALGPGVTTICLSNDCRQFGISVPPRRFIGADMLILAPDFGPFVVPVLGSAFDHIEALPDAAIRHAGRIWQTVSVFRAERLRRWPPPR